jgi:hypothetical protein
MDFRMARILFHFQMRETLDVINEPVWLEGVM